jgi:hypothetical protein
MNFDESLEFFSEKLCGDGFAERLAPALAFAIPSWRVVGFSPLYRSIGVRKGRTILKVNAAGCHTSGRFN